jgi:hypothetical protein
MYSNRLLIRRVFETRRGGRGVKADKWMDDGGTLAEQARPEKQRRTAAATVSNVDV